MNMGLFKTCDHCESSTDEFVEGMRGEYCSTICYYAEEMGEIHPDHDREKCPGCSQ